MTRQKEVARYLQSQKTKDWTYQWWKKDDAVEMLAGLLLAIQHAGPDAKLLAQRALDADGDEVLWLCVEDHDTYVAGFNKSHPCPPVCG
jgi:hypothetical protein